MKRSMVKLTDVSALVVDRNPFSRRLLINIIHSFGCTRYREASDGADALKVLRSFTPDIIFTEYSMTPLDGVELTRMVRNEPERLRRFTPIIMVSAYSEAHRVIAARDAGINEFVVKPYSARSLIARISEVILRPRPFVRVNAYFGPDRRRRSADWEGGERRHEDAVAAQGPAREAECPSLQGDLQLGQDEVDVLVAGGRIHEEP